jgi:tetratricopeptide (TPR) repeat protein
LGDLPLALEQAGAYIEEAGISFADYLSRFQKHCKRILEEGKPIDYTDTVATMWEISWQATKERSLASVDLLSLCSFLAPDEIPRSLLMVGREHLPEPLATLDDLVFDEAIAVLRRYSLMNATGDSLTVHRLVQAETQDRMGEVDQKRWAEVAVRLIEDAFPEDLLDNPQSWSSCSLLLPHAPAAAGHSGGLGVGLEATSNLLNEVGLYLRTLGEFDEAKTALQKALKIDEQVYGPDHQNVAIRVNNLGLVLQALGDFQEAKKCFERALKILREKLGEDHPNTKLVANNLNSVSQG